MRERGLKRIDAQDRAFWKLGCKNRLTFAGRDDSPAPEQEKYPATLEQNDDDGVSQVCTAVRSPFF